MKFSDNTFLFHLFAYIKFFAHFQKIPEANKVLKDKYNRTQ